MNHSHLVKNFRLHFNLVRGIVTLLLISLTYFLLDGPKGQQEIFNLMVMMGSLGLLGFHIYNSILREVNEGTWPYVVTSQLTPLEILVGQLAGASPVLVFVAIASFFIQLIWWDLGQTLLMFCYGLLSLCLFAVEGFRQSVKWESSVSAGKSSSKIESQLTLLTAVATLLSYGIVHKLVTVILFQKPLLYWYSLSFETAPFLITSLLFFTALALFGCYRNVQQAMKTQLSALFWLFSGWCIVIYLLGFTYIRQDLLFQWLSDLIFIPNTLPTENYNELARFLNFGRLLFVYQCWMTFLFISLLTGPISAAQLRNLQSKLQGKKWSEFLTLAPASVINFITLLFTFIVLFVYFLTLTKEGPIESFVSGLFVATCSATLIMIRESLAYWILSRLFPKKNLLIFCFYILGFWIIAPVLTRQIFGYDSLAYRFFLPQGFQFLSASLSGIAIIGGQVALLLYVFVRLQQKVNAKLRNRS